MKRSKSMIIGVVMGFATMFLSGYSVKADVDMWPLLEVDKESTTVCYPFYTRDGNFTMILNLYARTNNGKDTHIFWPFVKLSNGRIARVAPFWFNENPDEFILFPFIKQDKYSTLWTIPPVYTRKDGSFNAVFPFYVKTRNYLYIFPDIYVEKNNSRERMNVFPFYKHIYSTNSKSKLFYLRVMNYIHERNTYSERRSFMPFYEHITENRGKRDSLWIMPYKRVIEKRNALIRHTLIPFFSTQKSNYENYTWCMNYYSRHTENQNELKFYPFFGTEDKKLSKNRKREKFWLMWPFYSREVVTDAKGDTLSSKKRFLVFSNNKYKNGTRTFSILGFVIREKVN